MENKPQAKKYARRFILACAAYAVLVIIYVFIRRSLADLTPWRYLIALLPIIPIAFALYYQLMALRQMDELHRRIFSESFIISALLTGFLTFSYAFFEQAGFPKFSTFLFFPAMIIVWGFANMILSRSYR